MKPHPVTLYDLNTQIKELIQNNLNSFWVVSEISDLNINYSGHCYLELIQKDDNQEKIIAKARATIWNKTFRMIKPYFESTTGQPLESGLKIMVRVTVEFHEVYGLSLNIIDIEPTYTVGEVALRKQKIIKKLEEEGVINMNKELELPYLTQRIAIISSLTAAGLEDFIDQLSNNPHGYKFYFKIFPAVMQGNEAEGSIISSMEKIYQYEDFFDAVAIIRGGGSQTDLDCFNNYWLAYHIAQFPLPVLTGIGHEQDESVADLVANKRLKTPTAVAEFLIDRMDEVYYELVETKEILVNRIHEIIDQRSDLLQNLTQKIGSVIRNCLYDKRSELNLFVSNYINASKKSIELSMRNIYKASGKLTYVSGNYVNNQKDQVLTLKRNYRSAISFVISNKKHQLEIMGKQSEYLNPIHVLKRGYSITTLNNEVIKNSENLKPGNEIETRFYKGKSRSIVK